MKNVIFYRKKREKKERERKKGRIWLKYDILLRYLSFRNFRNFKKEISNWKLINDTVADVGKRKRSWSKNECESRKGGRKIKNSKEKEKEESIKVNAFSSFCRIF